MELFRPHSLPVVSVAETSYRIPCLLPEIRTSVSFIQPRRRTSHHFPLVSTCASSSSTASSLLYQPPKVSGPSNTRWIVIMEKPPIAGSAKSEIVDYYVETLARVVGSEREAQMCIYDASCESRFGFCCDIDEEWSHELGRLPGVISVLPDSTSEAEKKDYSQPNILLAHHSKSDHSDLKFSPSGKDYVHWLVRLEKPGVETVTKTQMVDYCTHILTKVLRNEKDAQVSIYNISWENDLGFCCQIDEESAKELSDVPGVLSVRPDLSFGSENKNYKGLPGVISVKPDNTSEAEDYSLPNLLLAHHSKADHSDLKFSPSGKDYVHWLVRLEKPGVEIVTKAQMVDYCTHILAKVLRNEKDAQVSIYNISWENDLGFCCQIDEECAKELSDVPGVLSVRPDLSFASENKNYKVMTDVPLKSNGTPDSSEASMPDVKTKRLFVTGLSFYTSEKTLRAAFEGFGELVEVKVIMDKISKRSKGYAFIEYTTEAAANAAYKEMNGKIINGWMIVVDVARTNPSSSVRSKGRDPTSTVSLN